LLQFMNNNKSIELPGTDEEKEDAWLNWIKSRDAEIRSRLVRGDEDTMINFLLMGVSFTRHPRISRDEIALLQSSQDLNKKLQIINPRLEDFIRSLKNPGNNRRLNFLRELVQSRGYEIDNSTKKESLKKYLWENLARVLREQTDYAQKLESIRALGHIDEALASFSQLYKDRGLSLDTSLSSGFIIEHSLKAMIAKGILKPGSIKRIAIIGPGLDFIDKAWGYDLYPEQTLQPFAVINSVLKLNLSNVSDLEITTFDISPRTNWHLQEMIKAKPPKYTLHLLMDSATKPNGELRTYWEQMGDRIGKVSKPIPLPQTLSNLKVRAVSIDPQIIAQIKPVDLNIICQNQNLPENKKFDLIIATNIFIYYNSFEQSLASLNLGKMLAPSGFLLCNTALAVPPFLQLQPIGFDTAVGFNRPVEKSDTIFWFHHNP
jgi:hypothetical protein